jgi:hypothetical protein
VSNWAELSTAASGAAILSDTGREEIIFLKGGTYTVPPNYINVDRTITLRAEEPVTIIKSTGDGIFAVRGNGVLTLKGNLTLDGNKGGGVSGAYLINLQNPLGGLPPELHIYDGVTLKNNENNSTNGGGVLVSVGKFYMHGGSITGNNASGAAGGGVYVDSGTEFYMENGTITKNACDISSGGVFVAGKFYMSGGTITGNTGYNGGGVNVPGGGEFLMSGGTITGNNATGTGVGGRGGGVYIFDGNFYLNSPASTGSVKNNFGNGTPDNVYKSGISTIYINGLPWTGGNW